MKRFVVFFLSSLVICIHASQDEQNVYLDGKLVSIEEIQQMVLSRNNESHCVLSRVTSDSSIHDLVPENFLSLPIAECQNILHKVLQHKKVSAVKKMLPKVRKNNRDHNSQNHLATMQTINELAELRDQIIVQDSIQVYVGIQRLLSEYTHLVDASEKMNIKKRKESLRDFYLRANAWNLQLQSKNRFLKSDVDAASPQSHEKMIEVMTVWSARIRHDNYNVMQQSRDTLLSQVNSLNEEVQNFLQRKERDAYKNKLRELVPLQQEYNVLDEKCDTYELVGVLKQLHDVGGPLDIEYISSTEQEKYRNVLQQSCSTQLDATIRYVEDKIQYMKPLVQSTQDDIIALLVPGVQNCMEEMKIPAPLQQDTAQDLIRFVLEQVEYCKNNGITGVLLQDYIQKNHLQWMHRAYLKNEAHEENIRRCSFEQLGCIENMKKRMIEKFID